MKKILTLLLLISLFSAHRAHAAGGISGRPVTINPLAATTLFLCLNDNIGTGDDQQCSGTQLESLLWGNAALTGTTTASSIRYNSGGGFAGTTASGAPMYGLVYSNTSSAYQAWLAAVNGTTPVVTLAPPADGQLNIAATTFTSGLWQMTNLAAIRPFDTVSGHSYLMGVYDNTASAYKTFLSATNGASPTVTLATPPDGVLNIVATSIYEGLNHVATLANTLGDFAATTSAQLAATISDETGTGQLVFNSGATLTSPTITGTTSGIITFSNGAGLKSPVTSGQSYSLTVRDTGTGIDRIFAQATAGSAPSVILKAPTNGTITYNNVTITAPATAATLTIANNKTLTASNTLTFTGTDSSSVAFGTGGTVLYNGGALGTPSSGTATNLTGTASGLTAGSVTTNANLTGPVTSVGNATTISANAVSLSMLATQAANTVLGNATSGSAVPTALSVGSCSTAGSALIWTSNSGFSCNTSITAASATALATGRTIAITGDLAYTSPSFDGSGNVTAAGTLATVNSNVGTFGSATQSNTITANGKGLITAISSQTVTPAIGSVTGLGTGVATWAATPSSANFFSAMTDETGSGAVVGGTGPTLSNPVVGTQTASDNSTKAASTAYVTGAISTAVAASNPAIAVQAATTAASNTSGCAYANGVAGIGATLTCEVNTVKVIDGYTFNAVGQRLLVKNDTQSPSGAFNGVYYESALHTAGTGDIFMRATDYDQSSDINNTGAIPVVSGTVNGSTSWLLTSAVTTIGTDPLTYAQFTYAPSTLITTSTAAGGDLSGTYPNPTLLLSTAHAWTGQQNFATATLTDASTISWNLNTAQTAKVTLTTSRIMGLPTNMVDGGNYTVRLIQGGSGNDAITWNAVFKWPGGVAPILSTAVGATDLVSCQSDATNMYCVASLGMQ